MGKDGETAYERWKGNKFKRGVAEFGECVDYLKQRSKGKDKADIRWGHGIWLGVKETSGEHIIGTGEGVVKARDIRRRAMEDDRWNWEVMDKIHTCG